MISIVRAGEKDAPLLARIGKQTFIESHGKSAKAEEVNTYVSTTYDADVMKEELRNRDFIYHILYHDKQPAGYSKIIFNAPHPNIPVQNTTKLERLYLLQVFYKLKLGFRLFQHNLELSKQGNQAGMWLFVWKENYRAVNFYTKTGFKIIGSYDFQLTKTHSNPNHQMLLLY